MADIAALLKPISDDKPSGEDLRLNAGDTTFADLEEFRRESDPILDPGGEAKSADWRGVVNLCDEALSSKTKDLELAAAYTQGLLTMEGWEGLKAGLDMIKGLVDGFWDTLHPGWDEGEVVAPIRARPLSWMGSSQDFLTAVKRVPLTAPIGGAPLSWWDYEQSRRVDEAATKSDQSTYNELMESGLVPGSEWRNSLSATPLDRMADTAEIIGACLESLGQLTETCDERFGEDAPYLLDLRTLLEDCRDYLAKYQAGQIDEEGGVDPAADGAPVAAAGGAAAAGPSGPIASRDDAFRRLREVADYMRRTEPHSPVSGLLERAVRWGNMSFEDLFKDVVQNPDARFELGKLLGLKSFHEGE